MYSKYIVSTTQAEQFCARSYGRTQALAFFSQLPRCLVAMETYGGPRFWGREIGKFGVEVRLIPRTYVKPFGKRQTNDAEDVEAPVRPSMRSVLVKSEGVQGAVHLAVGSPVCSLVGRCFRFTYGSHLTH